MSDDENPIVTLEQHASGLVTWRERKKQATREALADAAWKLATEVGPERVRVDEIAAAAGVSPRTFNNYFASREEADAVAAKVKASGMQANILTL